MAHLKSATCMTGPWSVQVFMSVVDQTSHSRMLNISSPRAWSWPVYRYRRSPTTSGAGSAVNLPRNSGLDPGAGLDCASAAIGQARSAHSPQASRYGAAVALVRVGAGCAGAGAGGVRVDR